MFRNYSEIMTVKEVMDALGICKHSVYKLIATGQIDSFRIGKTHKIIRKSLRKYINKKIQDEI